jgi:hypothetical protein
MLRSPQEATAQIPPEMISYARSVRVPCLHRIAFSPSVTKSRTKSRNRGCFQDVTPIKSISSIGPSLAYSITARRARAVYRWLRRLGHARTTGRRSTEKGEITVEFLCRAESNHAKSIPVIPVGESSCRLVCNFSKRTLFSERRSLPHG